MDKNSSNVCLPLPVTVTNRVTTYEQREQYLLNFLKNVLPSSDIQDIDSELKKTFMLNKFKTKIKKKKPKKSPFITMRKMILLGLNKFKKNKGIYSYCLEINSYWLEYMHNKFGMVDFKNLPKDSTDSQWEIVTQKIMKLDYHGAKVKVIKSKCPSVVGLEGIIMQDTKNTFRLVSKDDIIRTIPKSSSVFLIQLENDVNIEVFGKELCIRPSERSAKKLKNSALPIL